jgi:hypothetical protein
MERSIAMLRTKGLLSGLTRDEDGHAPPAFAALVGAVGAIVLGVGAATDSAIAAIVGGIALGLGFLAASVLSHTAVDYDIYRRLDKLEK